MAAGLHGVIVLWKHVAYDSDQSMAGARFDEMLVTKLPVDRWLAMAAKSEQIVIGCT